MADLISQASFVNDNTFKARVAMGCFTIAREVLNEDTNIPGNLMRVSLARTIIQQEYEQFMKYSALVVAIPTIANKGTLSNINISDAEILAALRNMWNSLAGVV